MLFWIALFGSLSGFMFGLDLGLIGGALLDISEHFGTSDGVNEVIVGAAKLGALFGTFLGGGLMLYYGRRPAMAVDSLFFIAGPLLMAAAGNVGTLVVGRFVVGVGIGVSAVVVPTYLGEVSPAKYRGRVVELYELLLCAGMLCAALSDAAFQSVPGTWRWMVGVPAIPALLMSFALWLLPESPRWLVIHGKLDDALAVIHRIYTSSQLPQGLQNSNAEVNNELLELWSSVEKDKAAAEERRQRRAAAREARETRVAPLAPAGSAREDANGGGVRFKGGWARLEDQGEEEFEDVQLELAGPPGSRGAEQRQQPPPGQQPQERPPRYSRSEAVASGGHSNGSERGELVEGGLVRTADAEVHSSAENAHRRHRSGLGDGEGPQPGPQQEGPGLQEVQEPSARQAEQQQQQQEGGEGRPAPLGRPPLPPTAPTALQQAAAEGQQEPATPQQQQQQQQPGEAYYASPFGSGGGAATPRTPHSGASSPGLVAGVSPEEVLPVPRSLRRIRTRSTEFEVVQEDLLPLGSQPAEAGPLVPPVARLAREGGADYRQQQGEEREGSGDEDSEGGEGSGAPLEAGRPRRGGSKAAWWRLLGSNGSLRARRGSTVPWTARQTVATHRGFWSTLSDMLLDIYIVARGPEAGALRMALWLAFFNQAFASTAIINYAPEVLRRAGVQSHKAAALFTSAVGGSKMVGVLLSFLLVDSLGRRPLLLHGSLGCAAALALLVAADWLASPPFLVAGMCAFIFAFSVSWAGVFWVLLSEIFSMSVKSPAVSAATAMLFLTGAVSDLVFLSLHSWLGPFCFLVFALLALAAGIYVARVVPETKGRTLQEVQQLMQGGGGGGGAGLAGDAGDAHLGELPGLLPPGSARSAPPGMGGRRRRRGWLRWR